METPRLTRLQEAQRSWRITGASTCNPSELHSTAAAVLLWWAHETGTVLAGERTWHHPCFAAALLYPLVPPPGAEPYVTCADPTCRHYAAACWGWAIYPSRSDQPILWACPQCGAENGTLPGEPPRCDYCDPACDSTGRPVLAPGTVVARYTVQIRHHPALYGWGGRGLRRRPR